MLIKITVLKPGISPVFKVEATNTLFCDLDALTAQAQNRAIQEIYPLFCRLTDSPPKPDDFRATLRTVLTQYGNECEKIASSGNGPLGVYYFSLSTRDACIVGQIYNASVAFVQPFHVEQETLSSFVRAFYGEDATDFNTETPPAY